MRVKVRSMSALSSTMRILGWGTRNLFPVRWTPAQQRGHSVVGPRGLAVGGGEGWQGCPEILADINCNHESEPGLRRPRIAACGASGWPSFPLSLERAQRLPSSPLLCPCPSAGSLPAGPSPRPDYITCLPCDKGPEHGG